MIDTQIKLRRHEHSYVTLNKQSAIDGSVTLTFKSSRLHSLTLRIWCIGIGHFYRQASSCSCTSGPD